MTRSLRRRLVLLASAVAVAVTGIAVTFFAVPQAGAVQTGVWYNIVSRSSGLYFDIEGRSTEGGAQLVQYSGTGAANQQFRFIDAGGGYHRIQARHSGQVLDVWEWNPDNGATIAQYTDLGGTNQQWQVNESGGYATFVNRFSGKALDVWEWSTAAGTRISQYDPTGEPNQQFQLVPVDEGGGGQVGLAGWAAMNGGTTGGGNAAPVTVSSAAAFTSAVSGSSAKVVRVNGTIALSGMVDVGSNTTVIGNSGAAITGGGLDIDGVRNVIVQNLIFRDYSDDGINVQDGSTNIWIDHNTFEPGYDGACDIKRGSDYITVSWNRFNGTDKTCLLGHSDGNGGQDRGHLRVTYHHNYFNGTNQRTPRVRFGNPVHVYNNYYRNVRSYCVATTMEAGVLVENNYFDNCNRTIDLGQGSSPAGSVVSRGNHVVNSPNPVSSGSVGSVPYSVSMDAASQVASIVSGGAGAR